MCCMVKVIQDCKKLAQEIEKKKQKQANYAIE